MTVAIAHEGSAVRAGAIVPRYKPPPGSALSTFDEMSGPAVMADNEAGSGAAAEGTEAAPKSKLKLIIIVVAALAVIGGGAAAWFFFFRHGGDEHHAEAAPAKPPAFVEVPDLLVNLSGSPGERVQYLKLKIVLELKEEKQIEAIKPTMPRVTDIFQTYVRELRPVDLNGSAGIFRLKEELTRRVNAAVAPIQVSAVLFKEVVIQ
jgi:flagellar FliL protein